MVRSRKVECHTLQLLAELSMLREFLPSIRCDRQVRLPRECFTHHLVDRSGCLVRGFSTKQVPALLVYQRGEACLSLLAHNSIRFPVAANGTVRGTGRTLLNGMRDDELTTTLLSAFLVAPFSAMPQFPKHKLR